jgi:hypothetical protein
MKGIRSLTLFELVLTCCLILVFWGVFALYANQVLKAGREEALRNELLNLRMSLEYYRLVFGSLPSDLRQLLNKDLTLEKNYSNIGMRKFLKSFRLDSKGELLDPFLHKYAYDSATGQINSATPGYQNW